MEFHPFNMEVFSTFYIKKIKLLNKNEISELKWEKGQMRHNYDLACSLSKINDQLKCRDVGRSSKSVCGWR